MVSKIIITLWFFNSFGTVEKESTCSGDRSCTFQCIETLLAVKNTKRAYCRYSFEGKTYKTDHFRVDSVAQKKALCARYSRVQCDGEKFE